MLSAAKGEYESFQVVAHAGSVAVDNTNLSVTKLTGPNGDVIPTSNITLFREHFVNIEQPTPTWGGISYTNKSLGAGKYADALIPFIDPVTGSELSGAEYDAVPINVNANKNRIFWIDVLVPRNIEIGIYTGTYTITSNSGNKTGKITLTVQDFELPLKPSMYSTFWFYTPYKTNKVIELMKNKLMSTVIDPDDQEELINEWGLNCANLSFWSGATVSNCQMDPPPPVREISNEVALYDTSQILLYNYTADEITNCPSLYDDVIKWAKHLHKGGSNQLITMVPEEDLFDDGLGTGRPAVDIWSVLPIQYLENTSIINDALNAGHQVWSYSALFQTEGNVPVMLIDFDPMNFRIWGLINQSVGFNGLLYWCVDYGILFKDHNIWENGSGYTIDQYYFPGDGNLFYPGQNAGTSTFCPSMRLKWLREAVEDYEYVELLKNCGLYEEAKSIIAPVAANFNSWSQNVDLLYGVRQQLAELILQNCNGMKMANEHQSPESFTLYPNPTQKTLYIAIDHPVQSNVVASIMNLNGQTSSHHF